MCCGIATRQLPVWQIVARLLCITFGQDRCKVSAEDAKPKVQMVLLSGESQTADSMEKCGLISVHFCGVRRSEDYAQESRDLGRILKKAIFSECCGLCVAVKNSTFPPAAKKWG
jgi:hypothetical protein